MDARRPKAKKRNSSFQAPLLLKYNYKVFQCMYIIYEIDLSEYSQVLGNCDAHDTYLATNRCAFQE